MIVKSAPFAALATTVFSTLYSQSLSKSVEAWDETAIDITHSRFPFSGYRLEENDAESIRATASIAVYDAIHAVLGEGVSIFYQTFSPARTPVGAEAAAAQAAHDVLASHFTDPVNRAELKLRLTRHLATLPDGYEKTEGLTTGAASAAAAITFSRLHELEGQQAA